MLLSDSVMIDGSAEKQLTEQQVVPIAGLKVAVRTTLEPEVSASWAVAYAILLPELKCCGGTAVVVSDIELQKTARAPCAADVASDRKVWSLPAGSTAVAVAALPTSSTCEVPCRCLMKTGSPLRMPIPGGAFKINSNQAARQRS